MALTAEDYALLSALAYGDSDVLKDAGDDPQNPIDLQEFINTQIQNGTAFSTSHGDHVTQDEWSAMMRVAAESETLAGFEIAEVATNSVDGSEMIYIVNRSTGEAAFIFEGTSTPEGWREDGKILARDNTASQDEAIEWAKGIMNREEGRGNHYSYSAAGHSKGGSQATALTREDSRIELCYSYDGPGDDFEHEKDSRIRCINNENDIVSALLFLLGDETLVRGYSEDPNHAYGTFESHSPANLFIFYYDENGVLQCRGLGEDVTAESGNPLRGLVSLISRSLGRGNDGARKELGTFIGDLLAVYMVDDNASPENKFRGGLIAFLSAGIRRYGSFKTRGLFATLSGLRPSLIESLIMLGLATNYIGAQRERCLTVATALIAHYFNKAWGEVRSWAEGLVQDARRFLHSLRSSLGHIGESIGNLVFGGPKVYDFSSSRLEMLERASSRMRGVDSLNPYSWTAQHGSSPFMGRLSLGGAQRSISSAVDNELAVCDRVLGKARSAFRRARQEDLRFAGTISSMSSSVNAATAMLA